MIDAIKLSKSNLLSLALGFLGIFVVMFLQDFHFNSYTIIKPLISEEKVGEIEKIINTRLDRVKNDFKIKKPTSFVAQVQADTELNQASAYGGIDFDTGEVLISKDLDTRLPIASITKVMSAVVALDLANPSDTFTVTHKASNMIPTKIGVVEGEKMTLSELINAALMTSANDAVQVIADGIDEKYGKGTFVSAMNKKSEFLKFKNTSFANPQGFDSKNNYSTVEDLAVLTHYALKNYPIIGEIAAKDYNYLPENENHKQFDLYNWNGLLDVYPNTIGLKIGNTGSAGYTTIVVSQRDNKKIIAVVLGAPGILERDLWASEVLDESYQKELGLAPINVTEEMLRDKYSTWKYFN